MAFKIYKKNNYIIIEDTVENKQYQGLAKNVFVYKDQKLENTYDFEGLDDTGLKGVSILDMVDSLSVSFTVNGFENFYTTETGSAGAGGGGGGGGDASASNQVIGNNELISIDNKVATEITLSAINTKTANLVSGRVPVDGSGVTQPISVASLPLPAGSATSANQIITNNSLTSIDGKLTPQFVSNAGALSGATQVVNLPITRESAGTVQITGTWIGRITFEATLDGTNFYPINAVSASTSSPQTTTTVNGLYRLTPSGALSFRANMTSFTSGTANILIRATNGVGGIFSNQVIPTILSSSQDALSAGIKATMTAYGYQRMTLEPKIQFTDSFDGGTLDVTDKWTQSGTVTLSNSSALIGNISTISTVNAIQSKPTFPSLGLSFQVLTWVGGFENSPLSTTNVNRFFGFHQHTSTPTLSQPSTDGVGLEWDSITGKLWFAVYQSGVRSASSVDLSASATSSLTRYAVLYRSDLAICYIGSSEIPIATIPFVTPNIQNLPIKFQTVIGASAPSVIPANTVKAVGCGDTGGNATQLADGTNPWRKAKIDASGNISVTSAGIPASLGNQGSITSQPVTQSTESASGNIITINSVPNGVATVGSAVEITLNGASSLSIQTTGTYTGALSIQLTNDGTRWETITASGIVNTVSGAYSPTIASASIGLFQFECGNFTKARIAALSAVTGTATVTIKASNSTSLVTVDNSLPTGTNFIGNIGTVATLSNTTQLTPGTLANNLGKAEDAASVSGDTGVFMLGVRRDNLAIPTSATGDYSEIATDRYGSTLIKDQTRHKRTYSLAFTVTPATAATDIFQLIGSATTTVSVNKINISGTQTTGGQTTMTIAKRNTANTGGTSSSSTMVVHDSTDAAATSIGTIYTTNPTPGASAGNLRIFSLPLGAATATTNNIVQLDFGERGKPVVLNGIAQTLAIALGGVTLAGGSINVWIEFTEE